MTLAEILAARCPECDAPAGHGCTGEAATCQPRLDAAWAHRLSVSCAGCQALAGRPCDGAAGTTCQERLDAAQPGRTLERAGQGVRPW